MATSLSATRTRFFDKCGKPLIGGKVYTYQVGTTTLKTTYTDSAKTTQNTNPILLDSVGSADIYLDGAYRVRVLDRNGVLVEDIEFTESWYSESNQVELNQQIEQFKAITDQAIDAYKGETDQKLVEQQTYVDDQLALMAPQATTYSKSEVDSALSLKAPQATTYTKAEVDTTFAAYVGGRKAYTTLALAQAAQSSLPANTAIEVTNDGANNGTYQWNGTTLTKSAYDPASIARIHTDNSISNIVTSKNLIDPSLEILGRRVSGSGLLLSIAGSKSTGYIAVRGGETYTLSWSNSVSDNVMYAFFNSDVSTSGTDVVNSPSTSPHTFTAPLEAKYIIINTKQDTAAVERTNVQLETGSVKTDYAPYNSELKLQSNLTSGLVNNAELPELVKPLTVKDYEVVVTNLFNPDDLLNNHLLNSNTGAAMVAQGWVCSGSIPVVEGQSYTLSGTRARRGLSFFADNKYAAALLYVDTSDLPVTVTAPTGAKTAVIALESATDKGYSNIQFEKGEAANPYVPYGSSRALVDAKYLTGLNIPDSDSKPGLSTFEIEADNFATIKASGDVDVKLDLSLTRPNSLNNSTVFNFRADTVDNLPMRSSGDDAAPLRADNTTVGANHGYSQTVVTSPGHGKTDEDVGSVWSDGTKELVLISINSADELALTSRATNGGISGSGLTHVSGAANTANITISAKSTRQWYPVFKNHKLTVMVDGVKVNTTTPGKYNYADNVAFHESYEIMAKNDIAEWLILNKGQARLTYDAVPSILCNYSYVFDKDGGCTIYSSITAYKSIPFQDWMVTQSHVLSAPRSFYVPKTIPFNQDDESYDFTAVQPMPAAITTSIYFDSSNNEEGANPVDRLLQIKDEVGYATGYLPLLDAEPSKRVTNASNKYLEIRNNTLKTYPSLIDGLKTTLEAGDTFSGIAYRKYFKRSIERTAKYVIRSNIADFLYLDWHSAKTDVIELDDDLIGRNFTVHEKSSNVTLLSAFATNNIAVKIDGSKSYGYLVLRFNK